MRKISEVRNKGDLRSFVQFPFSLYAKNPAYVPGIWAEEMDFWNPEKNPALRQHYYKLFLISEKESVVGRIAVLVDKKNPAHARFGWFDVKENRGAAEDLLQAAEDFARSMKAQTLEGPLGFTNLDQAGLLTFGFDEEATPIGLYNASYYQNFLLRNGFQPAKEWVEYKLAVPATLPEKVQRIADLARDRYHLRTKSITTKSAIAGYAPALFSLLEETYRSLPTFVPLSPEMKQYYHKKYMPLLDPKFISLIVNEQDELVAFAITMPAYGKALKKAAGKLWPWGWYHLLTARRNNDKANFYLIGIKPEFQRRGVTAMIFEDIFAKYRQLGIRFIETNPELADNKSVQALWQDYSPTLHKRRATFVKFLP